ncbi:MAG TPA: hypothetical protein VFL91_25640 [Thermomicrobiales bacterium]|nr:hypothetical protein [Thermomicrobiales bacterium]
MSATGGSAGRSGFVWHENDSFVELDRVGERWQVTYGFDATAKRGRTVVSQALADDYADAVRRIAQVIGYYFAEPEHAERVRRDLLTRAGLDPGPSQYRPLPNAKFVTAAGGGVGAEQEVAAEQERRERILRGEPEPAPEQTISESPPKRPWWRRARG